MNLSTMILHTLTEKSQSKDPLMEYNPLISMQEYLVIHQEFLVNPNLKNFIDSTRDIILHLQ